jgi:hypothetical protein
MRDALMGWFAVASSQQCRLLFRVGIAFELQSDTHRRRLWW